MMYGDLMKRILFAIGVTSSLALYGAQAVADPPFTPAPKVLNAQGGYNPPKPKEGFRYPDCFCTDSQGKRIELGKTTCLQIGSSQVMARCAMSLNNPTWRRLSDGCPSV